MLTNETQIRVRYGETDRMGYLHHGNYPGYFEVGRTELLRQLGLSYRQMEDDGILLPVRELHIKYYSPALYDELLLLKTTLKKKPSARLEFDYEIRNQENQLVCNASTTLVFVDSLTRRPIRVPAYFAELVAPFYKL